MKEKLIQFENGDEVVVNFFTEHNERDEDGFKKLTHLGTKKFKKNTPEKEMWKIFKEEFPELFL